MSNSDSDDSSKTFRLKKKIGLWSGVSVNAGTMIGSGIFIAPVGVLAGTNGSVGLSLVLWLSCGLLSGLAALCFAELGTSVLESGAEFAYINAAYGRPLAFVFAMSYIFIITVSSAAAGALAFGTYLTQPFYPGCSPPESAVKCAAALEIILATFVNYISVRTAARCQIIFTIAKFAGMSIIIIGGLTNLAKGNPVGIANFQNAFSPVTMVGLTASQIGLAFYQGLYSYEGWGNLNKISEEIEDVGKTLPRCIIISVTTVTVFYLLVNIAYFSVLTPNEMLASKAVAVTFADRVFGGFSWIMPLVVCLSVYGGANGAMLVTGRMPFAVSRRGLLPQIFSMVHTTHHTPGPAILLRTTISLLLLIPGDFDTLLNAMSFTSWIFYGLCAIAVFVLRYRRPDLPRPYKVPLVIPAIVVIFAVYLVVAPMIDDPDIAYLYGGIFMICTPIPYYIFVYKQLKIPGIDTVTVFLQKVMDVAPTHWEDKLAKIVDDEDDNECKRL